MTRLDASNIAWVDPGRSNTNANFTGGRMRVRHLTHRQDVLGWPLLLVPHCSHPLVVSICRQYRGKWQTFSSKCRHEIAAQRIAKEQKSISLEKRAEATYAEYRRQKASASGGREFRLPLW